MPASREFDGVTVTVHDEERQRLENWTRVVGYYRQVTDFNVGKQSEYNDRKMYSVNEDKFQSPQQTLPL